MTATGTAETFSKFSHNVSTNQERNLAKEGPLTCAPVVLMVTAILPKRISKRISRFQRTKKSRFPPQLLPLCIRSSKARDNGRKDEFTFCMYCTPFPLKFVYLSYIYKYQKQTFLYLQTLDSLQSFTWSLEKAANNCKLPFSTSGCHSSLKKKSLSLFLEPKNNTQSAKDRKTKTSASRESKKRA